MGRGRPKIDRPERSPGIMSSPSPGPSTSTGKPGRGRPKMNASPRGTSPEDNPIRWKGGDFVAIRNEHNSFYMAKALNNVRDQTKKWKAYWMDQVKGRPNVYRFEYVEWVFADYSCVICNVKMVKLRDEKNTFELSKEEHDKIDKVLNSALEGKPLDAEDVEGAEIIAKGKGKKKEKEESKRNDMDDSSEDEEEEMQSDATDILAGKLKIRDVYDLHSGTDSVGEDTEEEYEPPVKKKKVTIKAPVRKTSSAALAAKVVATKARKQSERGRKANEEREKKRLERERKRAEREEKKKALLQAKEEKRKKLAMQKRMSNALLKARASVKVEEQEPLLDSREPVPFVSTTAHSKLILRAVKQEDVDLLKAYIKDTQNIAKLNIPHSVGFYQDAVQMAMAKENKEIIEILVKEITSPKEQRAKPTQSLLSTIGTGSYNYRSLGVRFIRDLCQSRGSREGNNALLKDQNHISETKSVSKYIDYGIRSGVSKEILELLLMASNKTDQRQLFYQKIWLAVRNGHRKLAGALMEEEEKTGFSQFNALHRNVLNYDSEDLKVVRAASVRKKPYENMQITPIHCAAINPNVKYLQQLLNVVPEYTIIDKQQRRPIHFAAACEGTGPLEFLLKRSMDPNEPDQMGYTALHIAVETGRNHNVELLLSRAKADAEAKESGEGGDEDDVMEVMAAKFGLGGMNRPVHKPQNRFHHSYCPIHIAAEKGYLEIVRTLLAYGANVHAELGASKDKKTALMMAAANGHFDVVKLLVANGAKIEGRDKLKRTPLIHSILSGHTHIASYLLSLGSNANAADSSNNTVVHYAAGYGWYFCLKLLLDSKADPNVPNDWKMTPLGIAFMKGHMGLADMLLDQPNVDINFRDDSGNTLVAIACSSPLVEGIVEQIEYLVEKRGADCTIADIDNCTPLHKLAGNSIKIGGSSWNPSVCPKAIERSLKIAELLISKGCDLSAINDDSETPLMFAVEQANVQLVKLLVEKGCKVTNSLNKKGQNVLHLMANQCMQHKLKPLISILANTVPEEVMKEMVGQADHDGYMPLLKACLQYALWSGKKDEIPAENTAASDSNSESDAEEDEENEEEEEEQEQPQDDDADDGGEDDENGNQEDQDEEDQMEEENEDDAMDIDDDLDEDEEEDREDEDLDTSLDESKLVKNPALLEKKKEKASYGQWQDSRDFVEALITQCGADVNNTIQKKYQYQKMNGNGGSAEEEDKPHMYSGATGKQGVLHLLHNVPHEQPLLDEEDNPVEMTPCLSMILGYKPDMDEKDIYGRTPLILSITSGYDQGALKLIRSGVDVSIASDNKDTDSLCAPILFATRHGKLSIVRELLQHKNELDIDAVDSEGNGLIHHAVMKVTQSRSFMDLLTLVLDAGGKINAVNVKKRTPLHIAVNANEGGADATSELPAYLIEKGADVFALDIRGRLPLHYVFVKIGRHTDVSSCDPIELCSTLTAAMNGRGVDDKDDFEQTPLHRSALRGATVCCMHLIQKGSDINALDSNGNTPLGMSVFQEHESCAIMLMQKKANLNSNIVLPAGDDGADEDDELDEKRKKKPRWLWRPLADKKKQESMEYPIFQSVVYNEWQGVTYMMLDMLEEHNIPYSQTIEAALSTNKFNLALTLIRKQPSIEKIQAVNKDQQNLFHWLGLKSKSGVNSDLQERVAKMLADKGVSASQRDVHGCLPIHYSMLNHNFVVTKVLLDQYCSNVESRLVMLSAQDHFSRTPLMAFFWTYQQAGHMDGIRLLQHILENNPGVNLNQLCDFPIQTTPLFGYTPKKDNKSYFATGTSGKRSPLILAIRNKDFLGVQTLLKFGANVNFTDEFQLTPLMHAVKVNDTKILKLLLDAEYDPEEERKKEEEEARNKKVALVKQHSRRLFTLGQGLVLPGLVNGDTAAKDKAEEEKKEDKPEGDDDLPPDDIFLDFKPFAKKSNLDLDACDEQGWTAIHHLVCPLEYGTYDNVQLLKLLYDAGASITAADKAGLLPLDYAFIRGAPQLVKAIQKLMGRLKDSWERPSFSATEVRDGMAWTAPSPDYRADAESLVKQLDTEAEKDKPKFVAEPDQYLEMDDTGEVVMDDDLGLPYDTLLTKIDVKQRQFGLYNFYKMQLVFQKGKELYILFTRWGRIGDAGQYQRTPFPNKEDAVKEFCKIFRAKSGNKWSEIKSFDNKTGKYRLVQLADRAEGKSLVDVKFSFTEAKQQSKLTPYVQDLLKEITDVQTMRNTLVGLGLDDDQLPFARIKKSALYKARDILAQIKPLIEKKDKLAEDIVHMDHAKYTEVVEKIYSLSNEYFHLVPQKGYRYEAVHPLDDENKLKDKWKHLTTLLELECASRIMAGAQFKSQEMNPLDYVYQCLGCKIQLMKEQEVESQYLLRYVHSTGQRHKVEGIYRVARQGEEKNLQSCDLNNHMLLFHGSSTYNLISILKQGLRIAHPEAPTTGFLFGKGIYTADTFQKSAGYCYNHGASDTLFMLVCEVALGRTKKQVGFGVELDKGANSIIGMGRMGPNPDYDVTLPSGARIPLGNDCKLPPPKNKSQWANSWNWWNIERNEYIVYDESQICIRYIIQFKPQ